MAVLRPGHHGCFHINGSRIPAHQTRIEVSSVCQLYLGQAVGSLGDGPHALQVVLRRGRPVVEVILLRATATASAHGSAKVENPRTKQNSSSKS